MEFTSLFFDLFKKYSVWMMVLFFVALMIVYISSLVKGLRAGFMTEEWDMRLKPRIALYYSVSGALWFSLFTTLTFSAVVFDAPHPQFIGFPGYGPWWTGLIVGVGSFFAGAVCFIAGEIVLFSMGTLLGALAHMILRFSKCVYK